MEAKALPEHEKHAYVLVTGANSGLGFAICCRLIDQFLTTRPATQALTLIVTTRDVKKSNDTLSRLHAHLQGKPQIPSSDSKPRITLQAEQVDLTSLHSVQTLSRTLLSSTPKLNAIILNAGYGGFTGINWPLALWSVLTDLPYAITYPTFKLSGVGYTTRPQTSSRSSTEPLLGEVFCANLFGHYLLAHNLVPLLSHPSSPSRIIFLSSLEAYADAFHPSDLQGLRSPRAYECSKRLTDILVLTAALPSTKPWVDRFLSPPPTAPPPPQQNNNSSSATPQLHPEPTSKPRIYLSHPGICSTAILPLPYILWLGMCSVFYLARWLGSPWHTVSATKGACAPVWLALAPQEQLDAMEEEGGVGKWGSCVSVRGEERVMRTEVEGWGVGGRVGGQTGSVKGRMRGMEELDEEGRVKFEELGRTCWEEMERLRSEWDKRLEVPKE